jgi:hypothetical protein
MNSREVIDAWRSIGLEIPQPIQMKALLDTGASVTVISKTFATYCKLFQTSADSKLQQLVQPTSAGYMLVP